MRLADRLPSADSGFDLTPMIDLVLLMIVFFVLGTEFAPMLRSAIELPKEQGARETAGAMTALQVELLRDGTIVYQGERTGLTDLGPRLIADARSAARPGTPVQPRVIVRADRDAEAQHLNRLASVLVAVGVRDWRLATAAPEAAP